MLEAEDGWLQVNVLEHEARGRHDLKGEQTQCCCSDNQLLLGLLYRQQSLLLMLRKQSLCTAL